MEAQGIQQLKEIADGVLAWEKLAVEVWKDGEANMQDLPVVLANLPSLGSATYLAVHGIDKAWLEALDLDGAEGLELVSHIATKISVPDEKAKAIAVAVVQLVIHLGADTAALVKAIHG